ncbi:DUF1642 domain-containing protein [Streptococcus uberis]|uniref:DUF1642 domain-containing protein n=1 Tax=Streptococcus uberis TaxID=1349 RepID=UPI00193A1961|nr:DUF1642 domain-containing protein [Streptococcus uberis]
MNIEDLKIGDEVFVKGVVSDKTFNIHGNKKFKIRTTPFEGINGFVAKNKLVLPDQPKPVVPQFVADWYEEHKDNFYLNLHRLAWKLIENLDEDDFVPKKALDSDFKRWYHKTETAIQTLINMHQFGYTIKKEKLYNVNVLGCTLFKMTSDNHVRYKLIGKNETPPESKFDSYEFEANLTEKEIKQADERLWQFAKSAF